jgi:hypothetical protein
MDSQKCSKVLALAVLAMGCSSSGSGSTTGATAGTTTTGGTAGSTSTGGATTVGTTTTAGTTTGGTTTGGTTTGGTTTSGATTGGTTTGGGPGDAGCFTLIASIPPVDGGNVTAEVVVPLPLGDGGYAHRVVWIQSITTVEDIIFVADDSSGSFGTPQVLASGGYYNFLSAATDLAGNSIAEWQGGLSGNGGNANYLPANGAIPPPVVESDVYLFNVANVIPVTLASAAGFGILGFSGTDLVLEFFSNGLLDDAGYRVPLLDAGPCPTCYVPVTYLFAAPCVVADFAGNDGFCVTGVLYDGASHYLFTSAISTASKPPTLAASQIVASDDVLSVLGLPAILAMPPASPPGPTPVTLFWEESTDTHSSDSVLYAKFTSLSAAPSPIWFADAGYNGGSIVGVGPALLPWRGAPLAINPSSDVNGSFWQSWVLPPGSAVPPEDLRMNYFGSPQGYVDPTNDGGLVLAPNLRANFSYSVDIYELCP